MNIHEPIPTISYYNVSIPQNVGALWSCGTYALFQFISHLSLCTSFFAERLRLTFLHKRIREIQQRFVNYTHQSQCDFRVAFARQLTLRPPVLVLLLQRSLSILSSGMLHQPSSKGLFCMITYDYYDYCIHVS